MNGINRIEQYEAISSLTGEVLGIFNTYDEAVRAIIADNKKYGFTAFDERFEPMSGELDRCLAFRITDMESWKAFDFKWVGSGSINNTKEAFDYLTAEDLKNGAFFWANDEWVFIRKETLRKAIEVYTDEDLRVAIRALEDIDDNTWGIFNPSTLLSVFAD